MAQRGSDEDDNRMVIIDNINDDNKDNDDFDSNKRDEMSNIKFISSLKQRISVLEYDFDQLQLDYNNIDGKYKICVKENEILKEIQFKYDNKCNDYDSLREEYDGVKFELLSLQKSSKLHLNQNKDLQQQKNDLISKYEELEHKNIKYQNELLELQQTNETLKDDLIGLSNAYNDSKMELQSIKQTKTEENLNQMNNFLDEIRTLKQKISDLNRENEELKGYQSNNNNNLFHRDRDRDSFDENDIDNDDNDHNINYQSSSISILRQRGPRSRSMSKSSNGSPNATSNIALWSNPDTLSRTKTQNFSSEDMDFLNENDDSNFYDSNENVINETIVVDQHILTIEISESLWHDIDIQIIKIESLLSSTTSSSLFIVDIVNNDIDDDININDINKLPQRLQSIYNQIDKLQSNDILKQRYESMMALKDIKIKNLQTKISEIKRQKDTLQYNLHNLQSLYNGYKSQARSYLSQYKNRVESINNRLTDNMNEMIKIKYWQIKLKRYGISLIIISILIYLLYRRKSIYKRPKSVKTFFGII